jgi:hypothetical protein
MTQEIIYKFLRETCFILGFFSIITAIYFWNTTSIDYRESYNLHMEHFSIFVGLWAPTFFILSSIFDKMVDKKRK